MSGPGSIELGLCICVDKTIFGGVTHSERNWMAHVNADQEEILGFGTMATLRALYNRISITYICGNLLVRWAVVVPLLGSNLWREGGPTKRMGPRVVGDAPRSENGSPIQLPPSVASLASPRSVVPGGNLHPRGRTHIGYLNIAIIPAAGWGVRAVHGCIMHFYHA